MYFGSYGWSKGAFKKVQQMTSEMQWEITEGLEFPGKVTPELFNRGYELGKSFAADIVNMFR